MLINFRAKISDTDRLPITDVNGLADRLEDFSAILMNPRCRICNKGQITAMASMPPMINGHPASAKAV
jgi:hypothetical protein